jgi:hypothetical protein
MFIWTFLLRITHIIISQSSADSSWITLYIGILLGVYYILHISRIRVNYGLSSRFTTEHGKFTTGLQKWYEFPIAMATRIRDSSMEAFIQERTQQLFLLSDRERKGFIVKRDMQVTLHCLAGPVHVGSTPDRHETRFWTHSFQSHAFPMHPFEFQL